MKKIAVGDLGEFWYGDYKEPFVQLEGAIPGHPQGALLKDDAGLLLCAFCGKTTRNLGLHVHQHGLTARTYKAEVGLLQKSALVSEGTRRKMVAKALRRVASGDRRGRDNLRSFKGASGQRGSNGRASAEFKNLGGRCYAQVLAVARTLQSAGKTVSHKNLRQHGIHEHNVEEYFGTIEELRSLIGARRQYATRMTDRELLVALRNVAAEVGRTPSESDVKRFGLPAYSTYRKRFGSWSEACQKAGLPPNVPMAGGEGSDQIILTAFAMSGGIRRAAAAANVDATRVTEVLNRYGFPFPIRSGPVADIPARKAWAAEMARRLAEVAA